MLAVCSYQQAFEAFGFAENQSKFHTRHHHLVSALEKLGCVANSRLCREWYDTLHVGKLSKFQ